MRIYFNINLHSRKFEREIYNILIKKLKMSELTPKIIGFNRVKSADNVPKENFEFKKQLNKESFTTNQLNWIIEPRLNVNGHFFGGLALGCLKIGEKEEQLIRLNFGAVISVYKQNNVFISPKIKHLRVLVSDYSRENMNLVFSKSSKFINSNITKTNVLVFACNSVSKSHLIVAAYLMGQRSLSSQMAVQEIRRKRKAFYMNEADQKQLTGYGKYLAQNQPQSNRSACNIM